MEIIRQHSDYAIRALLYLGVNKEARASCGELAKACEIPKSFAYKILRKLTNVGLITSYVGRPGGFQLCKDLKRISLYEVVEAVQGPVLVAKCILDCCDYGRRSKCRLSGQWHKLQDSNVRFLKKITLQTVLAGRE